MGPGGAATQQGLTGGVRGRQLVGNTPAPALVCAPSPATCPAMPLSSRANRRIDSRQRLQIVLRPQHGHLAWWYGPEPASHECATSLPGLPLLQALSAAAAQAIWSQQLCPAASDRPVCWAGCRGGESVVGVGWGKLWGWAASRGQRGEGRSLRLGGAAFTGQRGCFERPRQRSRIMRGRRWQSITEGRRQCLPREQGILPTPLPLVGAQAFRPGTPGRQPRKTTT